MEGQCYGQLQFGYYKDRCLFDVESIVRGVVRAKFSTDKMTVAALLRGYDVIDAAKSAVEFFCPRLVPCADIIAMATRDAVLFADGGWYNVETGRRDGLVSSAKDVDLQFVKKGLLGGHTVGAAHCSLFQNHNSFYQQILQLKGILQVDQELALNPITKSVVKNIATGNDFSINFGRAMVKLGAVEVLTGNQGEIRRSCVTVNNP
ncbi:peroxidase [Ricinus communis]|uniref:peroxidase n=1 Tax=Ricinus communis TaxID=3988 RepID=B9SCV9_RICCO|nr:peroxidase [Ricinus communis]